MTRALMLSQVPRTALPVEPEFNRQSVRAVLRGQAEGVELVVRRAGRWNSPTPRRVGPRRWRRPIGTSRHWRRSTGWLRSRRSANLSDRRLTTRLTVRLRPDQERARSCAEASPSPSSNRLLRVSDCHGPRGSRRYRSHGVVDQIANRAVRCVVGGGRLAGEPATGTVARPGGGPQRGTDDDFTAGTTRDGGRGGGCGGLETRRCLGR